MYKLLFKPKDILKYIAFYINIPFVYSKLSYSQEGEDLIIKNIFKNINDGFYIDIGAHHPYKYSNTYLLYKKGWKGVNIDPDKKFLPLFNRARKRDINLNIAVGSKDKSMDYFTFKDTALNTFSRQRYKIVIDNQQSEFTGKFRLKVHSFEKLLLKYLKGKKINFINIDIEGLEYEILSSFNIKKYTPEIIAVENLGKYRNKLENLLKKEGYECEAKTSITEIYVKK